MSTLVLPSSPFVLIDTNLPASAARRFYRVTWDTPPPKLVWINPGSYTMGSPIFEQDRALDEGPQTAITFTQGFWMGQFQVSQAEYLAITGVNPSSFAGDLNRPVETVSWLDATNYCARLTAAEKLAGRLPAGYAYRLPTEAEWEYGARAGTTTRFSYGDDPDYSGLANYCWYGSNSGDTTHPVGQKLPNPWGLYDMHGNVWEWCLDWYSPSYLGGFLIDPLSGLLGSERVVRGGSWKGLNRFCRSASRSSGDPAVPGPNVGFRVVLAPTS